MIRKILIANRGEIAIRIAKTCTKMGIKTVGIFSSEDKEALHLEYCNENYIVGEQPLKGSYLNKEKILKIALNAKVDAIHPGYGFLSENYKFAKLLEKNGLIFIAPPAKAILAMGDKIESRKIAEKAGVNCIPGINIVAKNPSEAIKYAKKIGFPIMIKASAGGGGKGMRIARNIKGFESLFKSAKHEAYNAFGDDRIFIEKYIENPRHIEIQVLGDKFGNIVHLGERECSIQRRHQKIIEESPSSFLDEDIREQMGKQALLLARSVGYYSAGTVEYIVNKKKEFFFLEMNTRLQVEHPVTEEVHNIDLVEQMINIANDRKLTIKQKNVKAKGWAFESRLCAESPEKNFLPSAGRITKLSYPANEARIDYGYKEGNNISIFYDSMVAKVISKSDSRKKAIELMINYLKKIDIRGVDTNLNFLLDIYNSEAFAKGEINTNFIDQKYRYGYTGAIENQSQVFKISLLAFSKKINYLVSVNKNIKNISKSWIIKVEENELSVNILNISENNFKLRIDNKIIVLKFDVSSNFAKLTDLNEKEFALGRVSDMQNYLRVNYNGKIAKVTILNKATYELFKKLPIKTKDDKKKVLISPMPGKVINILVKKGSKVTEGKDLIILDAMKMENTLKSEVNGKVKEVLVNKGDSVSAEQSLVTFE